MKEFRTVASKIPNILYARLLQYCEKEGISPSSFIKDLIETEVSSLVPHNKAGSNIVEYNKKNDTFDWFILYDDGEKIEVAKNISPEFVQDALKSINSELKARELYLQKSKKKSVPAPTKIKKVVE
tara:strand:+ start:146 stop:523 length:378 start_codon:yes stop_codon:yes gene_type:complete